MLERLTGGVHFHGQALVLRAERQQLLAGNIANADTPGFVAREMDFAAALRQAVQAPAAGTPARVLDTRTAGHLPGLATAELGARPGAPLLHAQAAQPSLDGNSVDMDRERASFADNAVRYEAALRFINGSVKTTLSAITGQ